MVVFDAYFYCLMAKIYGDHRPTKFWRQKDLLKLEELNIIAIKHWGYSSKKKGPREFEGLFF